MGYGRREILRGSLTLAGVSLLSGCGSWSLPWQQPATIPRVGFLSSSGRRSVTDPFRLGLRDAGYVEGENIVVEYRDAGGNPELIPDLIEDLVRLGVDVLVVAPSSIAQGVRHLTPTLPIVVAYGDPVANGLVTNLARPGGTITGLSSSTSELNGKRLELLKEVLPSISRVAVLRTLRNADWNVQETAVAAQALGVQLQILSVQDPGEFASAFAAMRADHAEALIVAPGQVFTIAGGSVVVELATRHGLPTMFEDRQAADVGGLLAYGPNLEDLTRRSAAYVDKILKGANPADLPIERPTTFDFVINLKTAQALGLTVPPSILQQATEVIQ